MLSAGAVAAISRLGILDQIGEGEGETEPGSDDSTTPARGGANGSADYGGGGENTHGLAGTHLDEVDNLQIPVAIEEEPDARDVVDTVLEALAFWETNAETYAVFDVEYRLVDENAYLTIKLV